MGKEEENSVIEKLLKVKNYVCNADTLWLHWTLKYGKVNKEMLSHLITLLKHNYVFTRSGFPLLIYLILGDTYFFLFAFFLPFQNFVISQTELE